MRKMSTKAMRNVNGGGLFNHKCEFCGKRFYLYILWNQHQITELRNALKK